MPLDQEPPDGDYAAYIDKLVNGRNGAPGAVSRPMGGGRRRAPDALHNEDDPDASGKPLSRSPSSGDALPGGSPAGIPARMAARGRRDGSSVLVRRDHNSHTEFEYVSPDDAPAKADSLGPQGSARLTGIVQIALGLGALALFARAALHMTYSHDPFSLDHIVPLVLLGFIARMFLVRGNAQLRKAGSTRKQRQPRGRLP